MQGVTSKSLFIYRIFTAGQKSLPVVLCLISTLFPTMVVKAARAPAEERILEEVLVVAQKRPQKLQDIPVAVTAFSGDDLVISGIEDVFDLSTMAPALQVRQTVQSRSTTFRIRGVGTLGNNFGLESSVGLYVDGVYRSRQGSMINNMVDIDSVEVLRGPQGTLFGRNTLAGAVLLHTVAPTDDGRDGFADLTIGNYNLMTVSGAASLSAIEDVLALRGSAFSSQRDGYVDDVHFGDNEIYDRDRWGARLQALYTPSDALSVRFIVDYSERRETCCAALVVNDNLRPVALPEGATYYAGADEVARSLGATVFTKDQYYDHKTALNSLPGSDDEDGGATLTISWDLAPFTVTSITGYRRFEADYAFDSDHSDLLLSADFASEETSAWSQELRINKDGETLSYVAGLYYFNQDLDTVSLTQFGQDTNAFFSHVFVWYPDTRGQFPLEDISSFPLPAVPLFVPDSGARNVMKQDHEAYAVFGQADYYLTNDLMLTAGLRYTREEKDLSGKFTQGSPPDFTDNRIAIDFVLENFPPVAPRDPIDESLNDDQVTGTLKLSWFHSLDAMVYASFATGYKSGGTNTDRIDPELDYIFDPETSEAFEIGWKASFPQQALRVNLALHKTDIEDLQVNYADDNLFVLQNAGKLDSYGGELEVTWLPTDSLTLTAAYARTEGEFEDFQDSLCWIAYPFHTGRPDPGDPSGGENPVVCDRSGEDLHNNPEFLFVSAKQAYDVSDGIGGFILAEYTYLGKSESVRHDPYQTVSSYDLLNLRLAFEFERYDAVVTLWGRNILDEEYRMTGFDAPSTPGRVLATSGEPATYGITFRKHF
jgi:outer membrane receptor protein involved in Fe transport